MTLHVGFFSAENSVANTPPKSLTPECGSGSGLFRVGDALLDAAIAVTEAHVRTAANEADHDFAMAELAKLRAQRGRH